MKKQHIAVMSRKEQRANYDNASTLTSALQAQSTATYTPVFFEDLLFAFDGVTLRITTPEGHNIADFDRLFLTGWFKSKAFDDIALAVASYARHHDVPFHNREAGKNRSNAKLSQYVIAALLGIPITPFVFSLNTARFLQAIDNSGITYPMIIKSVRAAKGNDNYLVHSRQELHEIVQANPDISFIAQAFVPNNGDYRVIVMGDAVRLVIHRQSQAGTHLNNTSKGSLARSVKLDTLPTEILTQSVAIAQALQREITGVDMIIHKETGHHYFLEANNMPQLSTGSLVPLKIAALDTYLTSQGTEND